MSKFDLANMFTNNLDEDAGVQQLPLDQLVPWVDTNGRLQPFRVNPEESSPVLSSPYKALGFFSLS